MPSGSRKEPSGSGAPGKGVAPKLGRTTVLVTVLDGLADVVGCIEEPEKKAMTGYIEKTSQMVEAMGIQFFFADWTMESL